ncbi:hypothetical protein TSOC_010294, partial [Tetrabaena socialis]
MQPPRAQHFAAAPTPLQLGRGGRPRRQLAAALRRRHQGVKKPAALGPTSAANWRSRATMRGAPTMSAQKMRPPCGGAGRRERGGGRGE